MRNFRKFKSLLLIVLIFLVLGCSSKPVQADSIILNDLSGQAVDLASYKGKPVILFFWTTWCPYCRTELKQLNQQYSVMDKEGIAIIGVNVGEPAHKVLKFFQNTQLNFKMLLDKDGALADKYNVIGVPTYIFLNKSGVLISEEHSLPANYKSLLFESR